MHNLRSTNTDYNFDPDLEDDMNDSQASTTWAESEYGKPIWGPDYASE
mgnify:CR=1 FL=1